MSMNVEERMNAALRGREFWLELLQKYKIDNSVYVILIPDENGLYSQLTMKYLKPFLEKNRAKRAVVLTRDLEIRNDNSDISEYAEIVPISEEDSQTLLQFYCLYAFAANFVIASLDAPFARRGRGYLNRLDITLEDIFKVIVYNLTD